MYITFWQFLALHWLFWFFIHYPVWAFVPWYIWCFVRQNFRTFVPSFELFEISSKRTKVTRSELKRQTSRIASLTEWERGTSWGRELDSLGWPLSDVSRGDHPGAAPCHRGGPSVWRGRRGRGGASSRWSLLILFSASKNSRITQLIINNTCVSIKHLFNECVSPSSIVIVD